MDDDIACFHLMEVKMLIIASLAKMCLSKEHAIIIQHKRGQLQNKC
jgi:hypothetical protein